VRAAGRAEGAPTPTSRVTEAFNFVDAGEENFDGSMTLLIEGASWPCWWSGGSCATGAPPSSAAVALPLSAIPDLR
jgi:hypothetical protein